jgi:hypothetical protein
MRFGRMGYAADKKTKFVDIYVHGISAIRLVIFIYQSADGNLFSAVQG